MFLNVSNHPATKWSKSQRDAAMELGGNVVDYPFPNVPAEATNAEVLFMCLEVVEWVMNQPSMPTAAMVQGEFSLTLRLVPMLKVLGVRCVVACSERKTTDNPDGSKTSHFEFIQFRDV